MSPHKADIPVGVGISVSKCVTEGLLIQIISLPFNEFNKVKLIDSSDTSPSAAAAVLTTLCWINPADVHSDRLPLYLFIHYFPANQFIPPVLLCSQIIRLPFGSQLMMQSFQLLGMQHHFCLQHSIS